MLKAATLDIENQNNMKLLILLASVSFVATNAFAGPFGLGPELLDPVVLILIGVGVAGIVIIRRKTK
jgi:hypothetical protein